jgi:hypothetical protein
MTNGMISINPSSTSLTYVVIFQLHLHMAYIYRSSSDMQEFARHMISLFVWGSLLIDKLMSKGFQLSRLQAAYREFYDRYMYIDLICAYNLSLGHMISDIFHTNR